MAIRLSYYIYCRRNKISSDPELISYTDGFNIRIYLLLVITSLLLVVRIYISRERERVVTVKKNYIFEKHFRLTFLSIHCIYIALKTVT